jgi:transposase
MLRYSIVKSKLKAIEAAAQRCDGFCVRGSINCLFAQWRLSIEQSGLKELQSFSTGLMKDEAAVRAAMTYDWSNGQVEGNVNRLKMIKRMMFGRAGFAMLKARVLHRSG